jgi:hypothetical protein
VAENVIGNRPDAVLFQMSAPVQKKKRKKKKKKRPMNICKQKSKKIKDQRKRESETLAHTITLKR